MQESVVLELWYRTGTLLTQGSDYLEHVHCVLQLAAVNGCHRCTEYPTPSHPVTVCRECDDIVCVSVSVSERGVYHKHGYF